MTKKTKAKTSKNFSKIVEAFPDLADKEEVQDMADELDNAQELAMFAESQAGQVIFRQRVQKFKSLLVDIIALSKQGDHNKLVATIARLEGHLDFISEMGYAKENEEALQLAVDEMVKKNT